MSVIHAAAVQLSPVLYSREGTVERVVSKIETAVRAGRAVRDLSGDEHLADAVPQHADDVHV
jgi:hypothetical protein